MIAAEGEQVDLDADLEQQEDDTDIGQDVELVAVDDISWRERRDREADEKVAEHGRQPDPPSQPPSARGGQEDDRNLEDRRRRSHARRVAEPSTLLTKIASGQGRRSVGLTRPREE